MPGIDGKGGGAIYGESGPRWKRTTALRVGDLIMSEEGSLRISGIEVPEAAAGAEPGSFRVCFEGGKEAWALPGHLWHEAAA